VPITLPVAGAAALNQRGWFYPACLIIVGAHYLPFVFRYGISRPQGRGGATAIRVLSFAPRRPRHRAGLVRHYQ
jgi:hypothetical protein